MGHAGFGCCISLLGLCNVTPQTEWLKPVVPNLLLAPGTGFVEDNFWANPFGGGWFQDDSSALHLLCALIIEMFIEYSVQFSRSVMSDSLRPYGLQQARLPCSSPTPGAYSKSCPLSQ